MYIIVTQYSYTHNNLAALKIRHFSIAQKKSKHVGYGYFCDFFLHKIAIIIGANFSCYTIIHVHVYH